MLFILIYLLISDIIVSKVIRNIIIFGNIVGGIVWFIVVLIVLNGKLYDSLRRGIFKCYVCLYCGWGLWCWVNIDLVLIFVDEVIISDFIFVYYVDIYNEWILGYRKLNCKF